MMWAARFTVGRIVVFGLNDETWLPLDARTAGCAFGRDCCRRNFLRHIFLLLLYLPSSSTVVETRTSVRLRHVRRIAAFNDVGRSSCTMITRKVFLCDYDAHGRVVVGDCVSGVAWI